MGNCNSCTCNDKNEVQTFEVQVDATGKTSSVSQSNAGKRKSVAAAGTGTSYTNGQQQKGKSGLVVRGAR